MKVLYLILLLTVTSFAQFVPTDVDSLQLWLSAQTGVTVTATGDSVTAWADQSGKGNDAAQTVATKKPILTNNAFGSLKAIAFDGANDNLTLSTPLFTFTGGFTVFAVVYHSSTAFDLYDCIISQGGGTIRTALALNVANNAALQSPRPVIATDIWAPSGIDGLTVIQTETSYIFTWKTTDWSQHRTIANSDLRVNGTSETIAGYSSLDPTSLTSANVLIGSFHTLAPSFWDGYIAEILMFNRALTETETHNVETYLDKKYSLGNGLDYIGLGNKKKSYVKRPTW